MDNKDIWKPLSPRSIGKDVEAIVKNERQLEYNSNAELAGHSPLLFSLLFYLQVFILHFPAHPFNSIHCLSVSFPSLSYFIYQQTWTQCFKRSRTCLLQSTPTSLAWPACRSRSAVCWAPKMSARKSRWRDRD